MTDTPHNFSPSTAHVAAASINQTVGDWSGNHRRIVEVIKESHNRGVKLLLLPEIVIPGYSLGDRLPRQGTLARSWNGLVELLPFTEGIVVCVGLPLSIRGVLYNAAAVIADGKIQGFVAKENLATGDVEYENRWYQAWPHGASSTFVAPDGDTYPIGAILFEASGIGRFSIEICEDGWKGIRPGSSMALSGAEIVLNPSASWFVIGKHASRKRLVEQVSAEDHVAYLYTSLLGCDATRIIFDGSVLIAENGETTGVGRRFVFDEEWELVDRLVDLSSIRQARRDEGSWREQAQQLSQGELGFIPKTIRIPGDFSTDKTAPPDAPYWQVTADSHPDPSLAWLKERGVISQRIAPSDIPHLELELALSMGLRDYTSKSGISNIALALSGGRDSAMVALIVARMVHYDNPDKEPRQIQAEINRRFLTAYMATENSGNTTENAAKALANELGARFKSFAIQEAVDTHISLIEGVVERKLSWNDYTDDLALQNVQARLRGSLIWMLANLEHALLLSTSNKSEAAVGYTTMDGDTSGGLSPIADIPKSLVSLWLKWAGDFHNISSLQKIAKLEPTAELRPKESEQTDEGDLMPFFILDQLLYHFVQKAMDPLPIFKTLWPSLKGHYNNEPTEFARHIRKFVTLLCRAQWKRERFAISFRVTAFDLDPKTGFRFPAVQSPFTIELQELDDWLEKNSP
jgi:NAD+ synthase (glutamine-hydrolysing)